MKVIITIEDIRKAYIAAIVLSTFDFATISKTNLKTLSDAHDTYGDMDGAATVDYNVAEIVDDWKDEDIADYITDKVCDIKDIINNDAMYYLVSCLNDSNIDSDEYDLIINDITDCLADGCQATDYGTTEAIYDDFKNYLKARNSGKYGNIDINNMIHDAKIGVALIDFMESNYGDADVEDIESRRGLDHGDLERVLGNIYVD